MPVTHVNYDCTEIYRRSLTGYVSYYDYSEIYREEEEELGSKNVF